MQSSCKSGKYARKEESVHADPPFSCIEAPTVLMVRRCDEEEVAIGSAEELNFTVLPQSALLLWSPNLGKLYPAPVPAAATRWNLEIALTLCPHARPACIILHNLMTRDLRAPCACFCFCYRDRRQKFTRAVAFERELRQLQMHRQWHCVREE